MILHRLGQQMGPTGDSVAKFDEFRKSINRFDRSKFLNQELAKVHTYQTILTSPWYGSSCGR